MGRSWRVVRSAVSSFGPVERCVCRGENGTLVDSVWTRDYILAARCDGSGCTVEKGALPQRPGCARPGLGTPCTPLIRGWSVGDGRARVELRDGTVYEFDATVRVTGRQLATAATNAAALIVGYKPGDGVYLGSLVHEDRIIVVRVRGPEYGSGSRPSITAVPAIPFTRLWKADAEYIVAIRDRGPAAFFALAPAHRYVLLSAPHPYAHIARLPLEERLYRDASHSTGFLLWAPPAVYGLVSSGVNVYLYTRSGMRLYQLTHIWGLQRRHGVRAPPFAVKAALLPGALSILPYFRVAGWSGGGRVLVFDEAREPEPPRARDFMRVGLAAWAQGRTPTASTVVDCKTRGHLVFTPGKIYYTGLTPEEGVSIHMSELEWLCRAAPSFKAQVYLAGQDVVPGFVLNSGTYVVLVAASPGELQPADAESARLLDCIADVTDDATFHSIIRGTIGPEGVEYAEVYYKCAETAEKHIDALSARQQNVRVAATIGALRVLRDSLYVLAGLARGQEPGLRELFLTAYALIAEARTLMRDAGTAFRMLDIAARLVDQHKPGAPAFASAAMDAAARFASKATRLVGRLARVEEKIRVLDAGLAKQLAEERVRLRDNLEFLTRLAGELKRRLSEKKTIIAEIAARKLISEARRRSLTLLELVELLEAAGEAGGDVERQALAIVDMYPPILRSAVKGVYDVYKAVRRTLSGGAAATQSGV